MAPNGAALDGCGPHLVLNSYFLVKKSGRKPL